MAALCRKAELRNQASRIAETGQNTPDCRAHVKNIPMQRSGAAGVDRYCPGTPLVQSQEFVCYLDKAFTGDVGGQENVSRFVF